MIRLNSTLLTVLVLVLVCAPLLAQKPSVDDQWVTLNEELKRVYGRKDWPGAMAVLDRMLKLADDTQNLEVRGGVFYMKSCIHALAGQKAEALAAIRQAVAAGFTDYSKFTSDSDFDSLRGDPGFKSLLAEIKAKYGPAPLVWDRTRPAPEFPVLYDDPKALRLVEMRREFAIDAVVAGAKNDYEKLRLLTHWVSTRWEHSPNQMASKSDPVTILREAQKGGRFICREYARNAFFFKMGNDQRAFEHRTTAQLVLVPKGAPNPTKFAGGNEEIFAGAVYTSNPDTFYAPPRR